MSSDEALRPKLLPIETAPKDTDETVLLYHKRLGLVAGFWGTESNKWLPEDDGQFSHQPTHWMPMPELPNE